MNVTSPVMTRALLYFSAIEGRRSQKNRVDAAMVANVNDRKSYTIWYWPSDTA